MGRHTNPHGDEEHEQAELLVAVLQRVAQALQSRRVSRQLGEKQYRCTPSLSFFLLQSTITEEIAPIKF